MEIDETIKNWLLQIEVKLQSLKCKDDITNFCLGLIPVIKDYSISILLLLNNDKRLPTKALLRVLSELVIKFCWCMKDAEIDKINFYSKNERWGKTACEKRKKFLELSLNLPCNNQERQRIQDNLNNCELWTVKLKNKTKGLPGTMDMFQNLFGSNAKLNYLILHHQFNDVIHSDIFLLSRLIGIKGGTVITDDELETADVLKQVCLCCAYLFLEPVYKYHKIDFYDIRSCYEILKEK